MFVNIALRIFVFCMGFISKLVHWAFFESAIKGRRGLIELRVGERLEREGV
jgi:hypothetical protein